MSNDFPDPSAPRPEEAGPDTRVPHPVPDPWGAWNARFDPRGANIHPGDPNDPEGEFADPPDRAAQALGVDDDDDTDDLDDDDDEEDDEDEDWDWDHAEATWPGLL